LISEATAPAKSAASSVWRQQPKLSGQQLARRPPPAATELLLESLDSTGLRACAGRLTVCADRLRAREPAIVACWRTRCRLAPTWAP